VVFNQLAVGICIRLCPCVYYAVITVHSLILDKQDTLFSGMVSRFWRQSKAFQVPSPAPFILFKQTSYHPSVTLNLDLDLDPDRPAQPPNLKESNRMQERMRMPLCMLNQDLVNLRIDIVCLFDLADVSVNWASRRLALGFD
jgi:hypothetical protein